MCVHAHVNKQSTVTYSRFFKYVCLYSPTCFSFQKNKSPFPNSPSALPTPIQFWLSSHLLQEGFFGIWAKCPLFPYFVL